MSDLYKYKLNGVEVMERIHGDWFGLARFFRVDGQAKSPELRAEELFNQLTKCKYGGCDAINGLNHSKECEAEHLKSYSYSSAIDRENERRGLVGEYQTAGNRNPQIRYAAYKGGALPEAASKDERDAWREGNLMFQAAEKVSNETKSLIRDLQP